MGVIVKESFKQSTIQILAIAVGALNILFIYPKTLSKPELGFVQFLITASKVLLPFVMFGTAYVINYYYPKFKNKEQSNFGFLFWMLFVSVIGVAGLALTYFVFEEEIPNWFETNSIYLIEYGWNLVPMVLFYALATALLRHTYNFHKTAIPVLFYDLLPKVGLPILCILFFYGHLIFDNVIQGLVAINAFMLVAMAWYLYYLGELNLRPSLSFWRQGLNKEMANYAAYSIPGSLGSTVVLYIDTIMVSSLIGFTSTAIYTIPNFVTSTLDIPRRSIANIATPILTEAWNNKDFKEINTLYSKSAINQFIIGMFLLVGVWVCIDLVYDLVPETDTVDTFRSGKNVVLILGIARVVDLATGLNSEIISFSPYYRMNFVALSILMFLSILTNFLFIPIWGIEGAALATLLSYSVFNLIKYLYLLLKFNLQPFSMAFVWVLVISALAYLAAAWIPATGWTIVDIGIRGGIVTIVYGLLTWKWAVSSDMNKLIDAAWAKLSA